MCYECWVPASGHAWSAKHDVGCNNSSFFGWIKWTLLQALWFNVSAYKETKSVSYSDAANKVAVVLMRTTGWQGGTRLRAVGVALVSWNWWRRRYGDGVHSKPGKSCHQARSGDEVARGMGRTLFVYVPGKTSYSPSCHNPHNINFRMRCSHIGCVFLTLWKGSVIRCGLGLQLDLFGMVVKKNARN